MKKKTTARKKPLPLPVDMPDGVTREDVTLDPLTLIPYINNARKHTEEQVLEIAASIREWGFTNPILIDENNEMIAGHGRQRAAIKLQLTAVPCVRLVGLNKTQKRALILADNRIAENASWDEDLLKLELADLNLNDFDLSLIGFGQDELDRLLAPEPADEDHANSIPQLEDVAITRAGDVWVLGSHKVMCGDSSIAENWSIVMAGLHAALLITSPPYNQKLDTFKPSGMQKENPAWVQRMAQSYSDSLPEEEYRTKQIELMTTIRAFMTDDASLFYNHKIRYRDKQIMHPIEFVSKFPYRIRQEIVWARPGSITLNARMFMPRDERIYWLTCSETFKFNDSTDIKKLSSVWDIVPNVDVKISAPFPVSLPTRCIDACSVAGDIVVDPFCGSGTTLIAAESKRRQCIGMEVNPHYVDVIIRRWQDFTGNEGVLEETGQTFASVRDDRAKS